MSSKKNSKRSSGPNHRSTLSLQKTEIMINVYDLLPVCLFSKLLPYIRKLGRALLTCSAHSLVDYPLSFGLLELHYFILALLSIIENTHMEAMTSGV